MEIRKSTPGDLEQMMELYAKARVFMRENGNPNQWGDSHPAREMIEADIAAGKSYVCMEGGEIAATFYFAVEDDPTYRVIEQGAWLSDAPYGTIHAVASDGQIHGLLSQIVAYCEQTTKHLRIDTHHDNAIMQHVILKNGFTRCGIIHIASGAERIAFEKV